MTNKNALVIAISHYDNEKLNDLDFCRNDGLAICDVLLSQNYNFREGSRIIGRIDGHILREKIIDFFTDTGIKLDDTLFFYYSGHGIPDGEGDVYLSTSEIDPDLPFKRGYSIHELTKMMRKSRSKRIVAILDCCFSGSAALAKGSDNDAAKLGNAALITSSQLLTEGEGICLLASSQANQEAYALKDQNHSIFTYYLIKGLKGDQEAIDNYGYVTADSLGKFVYNKIMSLPVEKRPKQKPLRKMELSGDIVLAYYPDLAKIKKSHIQQIDSIDYDLGNDFIKRNEFQKALEYYDRVIKDENQAKLWLNKGIVYSKMSNYIEALKCFEVTLEMDPNNKEGWELRGMCLFNLRRYEEALTSLEKSIAIGTANENTWYTKGMCLHYLNRNDEALKCLDRSISINPKAELAVTSKGDIMRLMGRLKEALELYNEAIRINPVLPLPWICKGILFNSQGKYNEAIESFDTAFEYIENYSFISNIEDVWNEKGNALAQLEKHSEAIKCFDESIKINPNNSTYWVNKSFSLMKEKKFEESIQCCDELFSRDPTNNVIKKSCSELMNAIGCSLCIANRFHEANECFEKTLSYDSNDPNAKNFIEQLTINPKNFKDNILKNIPSLR